MVERQISQTYNYTDLESKCQVTTDHSRTINVYSQSRIQVYIPNEAIHTPLLIH